ncbi:MULTISPECIES: DMT family transporter [unclassified Sulfitobacter]|jgi:drug/metabolite transporter (DMT)-like permease|uniref:DMT family transporter n=1 Tax=unclassified Sulfitobacter TaxID=196795 RepID=UPI001592F0BA|nr:DMT family transporter [Sulfitobacter sp. HGT1]MBQ0803974.1 DMT family transporter [Sulfitobacter sp.]
MNDQARGLLITLIGILCVVPDSLFVRLIDAAPLTIAFWRLALAGGLICCWILLTKGTGPFRAVLKTGRYGLVYMVGTGASGVLFVLAVSLTSVANVVFILASLPIFATVYSRIFLAEPISRRMLITIAVVMVGIAIIAYGSGETAHASLVGDLLALAVSALFAAGLTAARHAKAISMVPGVGLAYLIGAALIAPFAHPLAMPVDQAPLVLTHGVFIMFSSMFLALGPRYITSAEVGLLVLLESVLAPLLVWAVVGEDPGRYALVGGSVVIAALFASNMIALTRRKRIRS